MAQKGILVRVSDKMDNWLNAEALKRDISVPEVVRQIIAREIRLSEISGLNPFLKGETQENGTGSNGTGA